jgi:S-adenosylmethionine synthetase
MSIAVNPLSGPSPASLPFEIAERKGLGHPDTICDALVENLSLGLSRFYLERFGAILHHNVDKALLVGGAARPAFGGGEVTEPIEIYLAGRATREFRGVAIPVDDMAVELTRRWLGENLRHLDARRHVRVVPRVRPTSPDLAALFLAQRAAGPPLANDTSFGVGYAPLDGLERSVLAIERDLNSAEAKRAHPEIGEDVKVMGLRTGDALRVTVACALVGRHVADFADYQARKATVRARAIDSARRAHPWTGEIEAEVNTADGPTLDSLYLTVTGLSAEAGDDGQVGRGNRVNGLITPYRPMSLEALGGKNPVSHVGKLYNVLATRIAHAVAAEIPGVIDAQCFLLSRIGRPITEPQIAEVSVRLADPGALRAQAARIAEIAHAQVAGAPELWRTLVERPQPLW